MRALILGSSIAFLIACGGGGGSSSSSIDNPDDPNPPTPTPESITVAGPITAFGSIVVGGIRFDTNNAQISDDGVTIDESELALGQHVVLSGTLDNDGQTGSASSIQLDNELKGPIDSIDLANNLFVVLGQTVQVDGNTLFDDSLPAGGLTGLSVGIRVEVHGSPMADGSILASLVEDDDGTMLEITGTIAELDTSTMRFRINGLLVDYSQAILDDLPNGLQNGLLVEVEGSGFIDDVLLATKVDAEDDFGQSGDNSILEGLITSSLSGNTLEVAGITVTLNDNAQVIGGTRSDLLAGRKVKVRGQSDGAGGVLASAIELRQAELIRLAGRVENVSSDRFTILGITVVPQPSTEWEDDSDSEVRDFGLANLAVGDYLEVRGGSVAVGEIEAGRIERDDPESESEIQAFAENLAQPNFELLGVTITTSAATDFEDIADQPISAADFFAEASGRLVKAEGIYNSGSLAAEEVEFELEDD